MVSLQQGEKRLSESQAFIVGFWGVRYQVTDVQRAITFYTETLGFNLEMQHRPTFGQVSIAGPQVDLEWPRSVWVPPNAQWTSTRARRVESRPSSGTGFVCVHC